MSLRVIKNQLKMIVSKYISQQETFLQNNNNDGIQLVYFTKGGKISSITPLNY